MNNNRRPLGLQAASITVVVAAVAYSTHSLAWQDTSWLGSDCPQNMPTCDDCLTGIYPDPGTPPNCFCGQGVNNGGQPVCTGTICWAMDSGTGQIIMSECLYSNNNQDKCNPWGTTNPTASKCSNTTVYWCGCYVAPPGNPNGPAICNFGACNGCGGINNNGNGSYNNQNPCT